MSNKKIVEISQLKASKDGNGNLKLAGQIKLNVEIVYNSSKRKKGDGDYFLCIEDPVLTKRDSRSRARLVVKPMTLFEADPLSGFIKDEVEPFIQTISSSEFLAKFQKENPKAKQFCTTVKGVLELAGKQGIAQVDFSKRMIVYKEKNLAYSTTWHKIRDKLTSFGFRKKTRGYYCIDLK